MFRAALQQKHFVVLKNNFAFQLAKTLRADGQRYIIKKIRPHPFAHSPSFGLRMWLSTRLTKSQMMLPRKQAAKTRNDQKKITLRFCQRWLMNVRSQPSNNSIASTIATTTAITIVMTRTRLGSV